MGQTWDKVKERMIKNPIAQVALSMVLLAGYALWPSKPPVPEPTPPRVVDLSKDPRDLGEYLDQVTARLRIYGTPDVQTTGALSGTQTREGHNIGHASIARPSVTSGAFNAHALAQPGNNQRFIDTLIKYKDLSSSKELEYSDRIDLLKHLKELDVNKGVGQELFQQVMGGDLAEFASGVMAESRLEETDLWTKLRTIEGVKRGRTAEQNCDALGIIGSLHATLDDQGIAAKFIMGTDEYYEALNRLEKEARDIPSRGDFKTGPECGSLNFVR